MSKRSRVRHVLIPDCQVKEGVPLDHLTAAGNYILDQQPDTIICIGDFADMPSLSSYDKGKLSFEGRRYKKDIECAKDAMSMLLAPINEYNAKKKRNKEKQYRPRMVMTLGNHEERILRAVNEDARLEGTIGLEDLQYREAGWEVFAPEVIVEIHGIRYCHYFRNPHSLRKDIVSGNIDTKLKNLGWSFTMGHQQTLQYGVQYLPDGVVRQGLIAGAFYQHDEDYMGPQGNSTHWRGLVVKNEVSEGSYDPCFVSLNYLLEEWL